MQGGDDQTGLVASLPTRAQRAAHVAVMVVFAALGWGVLLAASYLPGFGPGIEGGEGALSFATFFFVIVLARRLAVPLLPQTVVSLDSGFYIAAALCLGSVASGRLVALALTLDALFRLVGADRAAREQRGGTWTDDLIYVLYFGGMTGALVMGISWAFDVDSFQVGPGADEVTVMALVAGVGLAFLLSHYALQGLRLRLLGRSLATYARRLAVVGISAEASLLPIAAVVVFIYQPQRPLGFLLLSATYLLLNVVFSRLWRNRAELARRVKELETLNATSRELAASLQLHELVESVARETARAIPEAELVTLIHRAGDKLIVDAFDRDRRSFERFHIPDGEGPTGQVLESGKTLYIPDLRRSDLGGSTDSGVRAWLGVPLPMYERVEGVLAVQSRERGAFDENHVRVLEAVGAQTAVALQNARLYELAMVDGLTRLFVRRYFDARLQEEIERSRRFDTDFSVVMMDIDDFKQLNDTHGHQAGDEVLIAVADIVKRQMRGVDTAARYGGEEFSMVLPRTSMLEAYNQAERIRMSIEEARVPFDDGFLQVTASFGIASFPESGAKDTADLIRLADTALYRAKKTGKNRVELYWKEGGSMPTLRTV